MDNAIKLGSVELVDELVLLYNIPYPVDKVVRNLEYLGALVEANRWDILKLILSYYPQKSTVLFQLCADNNNVPTMKMIYDNYDVNGDALEYALGEAFSDKSIDVLLYLHQLQYVTLKQLLGGAIEHGIPEIVEKYKPVAGFLQPLIEKIERVAADRDSLHAKYTNLRPIIKQKANMELQDYRRILRYLLKDRHVYNTIVKVTTLQNIYPDDIVVQAYLVHHNLFQYEHMDKYEKIINDYLTDSLSLYGKQSLPAEAFLEIVLYNISVKHMMYILKLSGQSAICTEFRQDIEKNILDKVKSIVYHKLNRKLKLKV